MSPPDPPELEALLADGAWLDGLAVRLAGHGPTAEDAVQETWLAAIRRGPAHGANPRGWLGTVLRNAVRKARRGEVHRTDRERAWGAGRPRSTSAEEAESLFALRHDLAEALKALDEEARRAILLRFVHDLTLREVAERLDLPLSTADRRIRTALGELRTRLDDGAEEAFDRRVLALLGLPASRTGPATGPRGGRSFDLAGLGWMGAVAAVGIALVLTSRSRLTAPEDPADVLREGGRGPQAESVVQVAGARARSAVTSRAMDPPAVGPRLDPAPGALQIEVGSPDGVPVAGVFVRPRPLHGGRRPPGRYTDASGRSTFDRLASGKYEVLFDRLGSRTHTVVAGRSDRLHVELRDRAVRGTVVDAAGRPVPGAVVWLSATSAGWLMGGRWQVASVDETEAARTDEHGRFEIASFGDAALLLARAPGRGSASALRLSRRRGSQEVEVRLPGSGGDLAGRVYGEDGSPAAAVEVTLEPPSDRDRPYPRRTTWTDDRGHFRFTGVAAGERLLHVDAVDHAPLSTRATVPGPDAEVRLGRGRDVRGRVLA
ncbi:MAG: sigma-70 family RNA polymerase sigma factor, partial [Planctomycetota bacterium]